MNTTHEALKEAFRLSLDLEPMATAPAEGTAFTAYLTNGKRVTCERYYGSFVCGTTGAPFWPIKASEFVGWLRDDEDGPYEAPAPYVLSERQERAEYEAEIEDMQRQYGEDE